MHAHIIAISNQKGGVGKTTTAINLAHALALHQKRVLLVDLDPQGNATQGVGVGLDSIGKTISDLLRFKEQPVEEVIYRGNNLDLIPATPLLARVERELVGLTNSELRLSNRLRQLREAYDVIILDTPPTFGPLMNSALNASDGLIVPVDPGYFALMGIKELLGEIEEIRQGTNPSLKILGLLFTLTDHTRISSDTWDGLVSEFGELVFETRIRRSVKLKEAPVLGKTVFLHAPESTGAEDYATLASEVESRLGLSSQTTVAPAINLVGGVR